MIESRRLRWAGHVARVEEDRNVYKILTVKLTGKTLLERPTHRWKKIRMDLKEISISTRNCVESAQDRDYWRFLVNAVFSLRGS